MSLGWLEAVTHSRRRRLQTIETIPSVLDRYIATVCSDFTCPSESDLASPASQPSVEFRTQRFRPRNPNEP
jgi:hypothetical protein